jgi:hypothetical protein
VGIVLEAEEPYIEDEAVVRLNRLPAFILVKLRRTRASQLRGLEAGVILVQPVASKFQISIREGRSKEMTRTITR